MRRGHGDLAARRVPRRRGVSTGAGVDRHPQAVIGDREPQRLLGLRGCVDLRGFERLGHALLRVAGQPRDGLLGVRPAVGHLGVVLRLVSLQERHPGQHEGDREPGAERGLPGPLGTDPSLPAGDDVRGLRRRGRRLRVGGRLC